MLASQCFGSKSLPPLVLLHGFLGSSADWSSLIPELENHFHLVLIDLPGHGDSPVFPEMDFSVFAKVFEQTVTQSGLKQFALLGYSLGGRLAMSYARQFPHRLKALLLEGSHPGLLDDEEKNARLASDKRWANRFIKEPVGKVLGDWYQQSVFADLNDAQRQKLIEIRSAQNGSDLGQVMMAFSLGGQPDFRPCLREAHYPVHYFYGERDNKFAGLGQRMKEAGCLTSLQCISDSGHNIHREKPAELAKVILQLAGNDYER